VQYLGCKLILKPDRFVSAEVFLEYGKIVAQAAKESGSYFSTSTSYSRLYNSAFILRRRIRYEDGFPVGDPETVH
jgi:hypothetical protein